MSKVIICIHGLGNKPREKLLTDWWAKSIREGLKNIGAHFFHPKIKMIYWADLLYEKPLDEKVTDHNSPYFLYEKYQKSPADYKPEKHLIRKKFLDWIEKQVDRLFLNDDQTVNFSFISNYIIHKYFKDLETYYNKELTKNGRTFDVRELIRNRLIETLDKHKKNRILLVSHSMGTIIAYDVLLLQMTSANLDTFVTMGSPLGIPVVMGKIAAEYKTKFGKNQKLSTPECVKKAWFNYSDIEDKVAINYNLADDYEANRSGIRPIDFIVTNDYIIEGERNPHKSYGYLRTPEFSKIIYEFLLPDKNKISIRFIKFYDNFYSRIINIFKMISEYIFKYNKA